MDLSTTIAVRLADEGVPVRAIARATRIPSPVLYETLTEAKHAGTLLELPRDDWPPGCPRDQRALQLSRMMAEDHETLLLATQRLFSLTRTPAALFLHLVQHHAIPSHDRKDIGQGSFNVHIWHMRQRLAPFGLTIVTLWGYGYQLSPEDRRKAMELILDRVTSAPAL